MIRYASGDGASDDAPRIQNVAHRETILCTTCTVRRMLFEPFDSIEQKSNMLWSAHVARASLKQCGTLLGSHDHELNFGGDARICLCPDLCFSINQLMKARYAVRDRLIRIYMYCTVVSEGNEKESQ
jgi:hypothetical protein